MQAAWHLLPESIMPPLTPLQPFPRALLTVGMAQGFGLQAKVAGVSTVAEQRSSDSEGVNPARH